MSTVAWIAVAFAGLAFIFLGLLVALAKLEDHEPEYDLENWIGDLLEERRSDDSH